MEMTGKTLARKRVEELLADVPWKNKVSDHCLTYWATDNLVTDRDGEIVYDVFSYISPSDFEMFKDNPYGCIYFVKAGTNDQIVSMSYKMAEYYEPGDYKVYFRDIGSICRNPSHPSKREAS